MLLLSAPCLTGSLSLIYQLPRLSTMATSQIDPPAAKIGTDKPWYTSYPAAQSSPSSITRETLLSWIEEGQFAAKQFVLVDLRRTDHKVCPQTLREQFIYG
jgi:hypothetical protein